MRRELKTVAEAINFYTDHDARSKDDPLFREIRDAMGYTPRFEPRSSDIPAGKSNNRAWVVSTLEELKRACYQAQYVLSDQVENNEAVGKVVIDGDYLDEPILIVETPDYDEGSYAVIRISDINNAITLRASISPSLNKETT